MMSNDAELACAHALDELRYHLEDLNDTPFRNRVISKIDELEVFIAKLLNQEMRQASKED